MAVQAILTEIDNLKMGIESIAVLVSQDKHTCLQPCLNYLHEQRLLLSQKLATAYADIDVTFEEIK